MREAEMVFTTLSSTRRRIFQRLEGTPFETVLIDEAAQASEIAALQPLVFGAKRCTHPFSAPPLPKPFQRLSARQGCVRLFFESQLSGPASMCTPLRAAVQGSYFLRNSITRCSVANVTVSLSRWTQCLTGAASRHKVHNKRKGGFFKRTDPSFSRRPCS